MCRVVRAHLQIVAHGVQLGVARVHGRGVCAGGEVPPGGVGLGFGAAGVGIGGRLPRVAGAVAVGVWICLGFGRARFKIF